MDHTEEQRAQFRQAFAVVRRRQLTIWLGLGASVLSYRNCRCPACDRPFGKGFNPKPCKHCGVELRA